MSATWFVATFTREPVVIEPVRLCCGLAHNGPLCPDGKVMCCLCFARVELKNLNKVNGTYEDVCIPCAEYEKEIIKKRGKSN
jgi:hypothetical protein